MLQTNTRRATPDLDLNDTRFSSAHTMLRKNIMLSKALDLYCDTEDESKLKLTEDDWKVTAEMESMMDACKDLTKVAQMEIDFTGAFRYEILSCHACCADAATLPPHLPPRLPAALTWLLCHPTCLLR